MANSEPPDRRVNAYRPDLAARMLEDRVAAARYADAIPMQVAAAAVPLRRAPGVDQPIDTEALFGERVDVYEQAGEWAWIQLVSDRYVGYVPQAALQPVGVAPTHRVSALRTYIYSQNDIKSPPAALISLNAFVSVAAEEGELVRLDQGGYVFAGHLRRLGAHAPDFVTMADAFFGTPYLWGGRTSLGLDCSGLVQMALTAAGLDCPRDTDMQERALGEALADAVAPDRLRRGDLVFWKGHVGIVSEPGTLTHANAHHMMVVMEPLAQAVERIAAAGSQISSVRRPAALSGAADQ